jgi:hypothetical protein
MLMCIDIVIMVCGVMVAGFAVQPVNDTNTGKHRAAIMMNDDDDNDDEYDDDNDDNGDNDNDE